MTEENRIHPDQYPEDSHDLVRLLTGVESARREYEQALDEVNDRLTKDLEVSVRREVDAYRILKNNLPSFGEDKARGWLRDFKRAQALTHLQLETTKFCEAMGMSYRVRNDNWPVSLYLLDPVLGRIPHSVDQEHLSQLFERRISWSKEDTVLHDLDLLCDDDQAFLRRHYAVDPLTGELTTLAPEQV